ncbi:hypothetical protein GYH30_053437 [Glycine max]|nr:hypothetical protein GYH30_053437 [Glycine max]
MWISLPSYALEDFINEHKEAESRSKEAQGEAEQHVL